MTAAELAPAGQRLLQPLLDRLQYDHVLGLELGLEPGQAADLDWTEEADAIEAPIGTASIVRLTRGEVQITSRRFSSTKMIPL